MSASQIKSDISELTNIDKELKRLNELAKPLRQRKKQLEESILNYMNTNGGDKGLKAIKMTDVQIECVQKKRHERLGKDDKEVNVVQYLASKGLNDPRKAYYELQELTKGKEEIKQSLKLKKK